MGNINIQKQTNPGMEMVTLNRQKVKVKELYITIHPNLSEEPLSMVDRLTRLLKEQNARIVKFDVFGSLDKFSVFMNSLKNAYREVNWPVTWVEGGSCFEDGIAGMRVHAVSGVSIETIFLDGRPIGRVFKDDFAKYCIIGSVLPDSSSASREEQTWNTLVNIERALRLAGMDMSNLVRTWFHNDNILSWYGEFNTVRNRFLKDRGIFDKFLPASTGIGGKNPAHAALIASAIAIQSKKDNVTVEKILSPIQCPAPEYGSSFNRAVEIAMPDYRCVLVSGTASIDPGGEVAHVGDIDAQVAFTMEVVEAILMSRGMSYSDVTRAIVYFKHAKDAPAFNKYCKNYRKSAMPVIITHSDICRDDLLFEIEVDTIV